MSLFETLILNGLALNTFPGGVFNLEAVDFTPPAKKSEWAQSSDADGANLVRTPLFENRTVTATIRVNPTEMNVALEKIGELVDRLQEAEKNPGGVPLEWEPANSTKGLTFYVLSGAVTGIPVTVESGWFQASPQLVIAMTCKPFGYGTEVQAVGVTANETGLSVAVIELPAVAGDVPAEGRLIVKDTATVGRRFVEWGLEQRYLNKATSLVLDNELMTPVGGVQSEAANTGAYKPGPGTKGTIATTLVGRTTICCETGNLKHVGTFRVKARVQAVLGSESLAGNVYARLSYQDGEGPFRANEWATCPLGGKFVELDLGTITLTEAISGTQKWTGRVEASSKNRAAADVLHVDYLVFVPVLEGYGKARAPWNSANTGAGTISAFDNFTTGTLSGNLNGRTPATGAAWATSGETTDFTVTKGAATRSTTADAAQRFAVFGSAVGNSRAAFGVGVTLKTKEGTTSIWKTRCILRWVNSENYAFLQEQAIDRNLESGLEASGLVSLGVVVANVTTILAEAAIPGYRGPELPSFSHPIFVGLYLTALLDGSLQGTVVSNGVTVVLSGSSTAIATGGALASGKAGFSDENHETGEGTPKREYSELAAWTLPAIPYCVQPSRTMEVRSASTITQDSTGTYTGAVPEYRGSRFYVPQAGSAARTSRVIVKADRNDLEESDQQAIGDAFTARAFVTPRYHVIPR